MEGQSGKDVLFNAMTAEVEKNRARKLYKHSVVDEVEKLIKDKQLTVEEVTEVLDKAKASVMRHTVVK